MINTDESKLPRTKLQARVKSVAPQDSFRALKTACDFLHEGMAAIIGPKSPSNIAVLLSTCDTFQIPLLLTHWIPRNLTRNHVINFFPDSRILAKAFIKFVENDNWKSFTLIFEDNEALIRLQEVLQLPTSDKKNQVKITLRHVKPDQDFTKFMKDLSKLRENNFIVDLPLHRVRELLIAAEKINMTTEYQKYLLTSLDVHTMDWPQELIGRSNITAFRLVNPENREFKTFLDEWIFSEQTIGKDVSSKQPITTEAALLYDALLSLSRALNEIDRGRAIQLKSLQCDGTDVWEYGTIIANHMKMIKDLNFYLPRGANINSRISNFFQLRKKSQRSNVPRCSRFCPSGS
ncbi:glutamate receptor ionotropic, kainate 2 [Trichonephila inaurata madagascariensis]|uniref:Glutamate receptor ionotropic, kainate 2 n=3 Tax=Nephilidae TaxID=450948 RepID=A0A8X7C2G6_9ARAC|nr:glutamate receptor ionotropic, kainate 2 [Trichonephila inaurata madagascariensis]